MKQLEQMNIGGIFYLDHYRDNKLIGSSETKNLFVNEGLVYALNSAFGVSVGGAPSPVSVWYMGLSTANRTWVAGDTAATVHATSSEFELYDEAARPAWNPQALALTSSITLDDSGAEAEFTIGDLTGLGGSANIYGGFLISTAAKTGANDATAILAAGSNFNNAPRVVYENDVLKVGYILATEDKV